MKSAFSILSILLLLQCHEATENRSSYQFIYNRGIGSAIPINVAEQWISNSRGKQSAADNRNKEDMPFTLTPSALAEALASSPDVIGATFQNAIDSYGTLHMLFVPFVEGLTFDNNVVPVLDMTTGATVNRLLATAWTRDYTAKNPNAIRYYFFGRDVLDEILTIESLSSLEAVNGLTNEGDHKLVLLAHKIESGEGGRLKDVQSVAYDNSCPCPNTCAN